MLVFGKFGNWAELNSEQKILIKNFVLQFVLDPERENFLYMSNYQSKVFNFDSPNKYKENFKILIAIRKILRNKKFELEISKEELEKFIRENDIKSLQNKDEEIEIYLTNSFLRNEFVFTKLAQNQFLKEFGVDMLELGKEKEDRIGDLFPED